METNGDKREFCSEFFYNNENFESEKAFGGEGGRLGVAVKYFNNIILKLYFHFANRSYKYNDYRF